VLLVGGDHHKGDVGEDDRLIEGSEDTTIDARFCMEDGNKEFKQVQCQYNELLLSRASSHKRGYSKNSTKKECSDNT
jgi:hypothetical protein